MRKSTMILWLIIIGSIMRGILLGLVSSKTKQDYGWLAFLWGLGWGAFWFPRYRQFIDEERNQEKD